MQRLPKLLNHSEEIDLFRQVEAGDKEAVNRLVERNLRLVFNLARTYRGSHLEIEDRVQSGVFGLFRAAQKFDWRSGNKFSTYATPWIRQCLSRSEAIQGRTIRLPTYVVDRINAFSRTCNLLRQKLQREPTDDEVWAALGIKSKESEDSLKLGLRISELGLLDEPVVGEIDEDSSLGDFIADPRVDVEGDLIAAERSKALRAAIASLPAQQREVLTLLLYGESDDPSRRLGLNMKEIGDRLGITREAVRQIIGKAMWKLQFSLVSWDGDHGAGFRIEF